MSLSAGTSSATWINLNVFEWFSGKMWPSCGLLPIMEIHELGKGNVQSYLRH